MQIILGVFGLTVFALALAFVAALFDDSWGLRIAAILIARRDARVAYRAQFSKTYRERCAEFEIPEKFGPADAAQEERA